MRGGGGTESSGCEKMAKRQVKNLKRMREDSTKEKGRTYGGDGEEEAGDSQITL